MSAIAMCLSPLDDEAVLQKCSNEENDKQQTTNELTSASGNVEDASDDDDNKHQPNDPACRQQVDIVPSLHMSTENFEQNEKTETENIKETDPQQKVRQAEINGENLSKGENAFVKKEDLIKSSTKTLDDNSSKENEDVHDPDWTEERFRVDRRNLEQMLQAAADGKGQSGEEFFGNIMEKARVKIAWPSKIKIGAKSKKDPHVKVMGKQQDVAVAKEMIMRVLDTKSTRVTLKMDVAHTEHSHVIGKGGNNVRKVMDDTGCHIHFPDSNRTNTAEKSNQVSIAGQPAGVESAREKIRALLPVVVSFDLTVSAAIPDPNSAAIQRIVQIFGIGVQFKQRAKSYCTTTCTVRGSTDNLPGLMEGTRKLQQYLVGSTMLHVTSQMEVAPQQHAYMVGRNASNVNQIIKHTGAQIRFPDPNTLTRKSIVISGPVESVVVARQQLMGCLPLVLMFDAKSEDETTTQENEKNNKLMEELDVFISVKFKPRQPNKSVIVKSVERNVAAMFEARRRMLGLEKSGITVPPPSQPLNIMTSSPHQQPLITLTQPPITPAPATPNPHYIGIIQSNGVALLNGLASRTTAAAPNPAPSLAPSAGVASPLIPAWQANAINHLSSAINNNSPQQSAFTQQQSVRVQQQQQQLILRAQLKAVQQQQLNSLLTTTTSNIASSSAPNHHNQQITSSSANNNGGGSSMASDMRRVSSPIQQQRAAANFKNLNNIDAKVMAAAVAAHIQQQQQLKQRGNGVEVDVNKAFLEQQNNLHQQQQNGEQQQQIANMSATELRAILNREPINAQIQQQQQQSHQNANKFYATSSSSTSPAMKEARTSPVQQQQVELQQACGGDTLMIPGGQSASSSSSSIDLHASLIAFHNSKNASNNFHRDTYTLHNNNNSNNTSVVNSSDTPAIPPGFERVVKQSHHDHPLMTDHDYEWVKRRAFELMKRQPVADKVRTPTDQWSGLGFSQSMPNPKFKNQKYITELETTYENTDEDGGSELTTTSTTNNNNSSMQQQARFQMSMGGSSSGGNCSLLPPNSSFSSSGAGGSGLKSTSALMSWRERNQQFSNSYNPNTFNKRRFGFLNKLPPPPHPNDEQQISMLNGSPAPPVEPPATSSVAKQNIENALSLLNNQVMGKTQSSSNNVELRDVLTHLNLDKYMNVFTNQEVDLQTFLTLNDSDLTELGITAFGPRKKILLAIEELKKHRSSNSNTSSLTFGAGGGGPSVLDGFFNKTASDQQSTGDKLHQQSRHQQQQQQDNSSRLFARGIASHSGRW